MHVELPYGQQVVTLDLPDSNLIGVLEGKDAQTLDVEEAFDRAWQAPIGVVDPAGIISALGIDNYVTDRG